MYLNWIAACPAVLLVDSTNVNTLSRRWTPNGHLGDSNWYITWPTRPLTWNIITDTTVSPWWRNDRICQGNQSVNRSSYKTQYVLVMPWSHRVHDAFVQRHDSDTIESLGKSWVIGDHRTTVAQHLQHRGTVAPSWVKVWHAQLCSTIICRVAFVSLTYDSRATVVWRCAMSWNHYELSDIVAWHPRPSYDSLKIVWLKNKIVLTARYLSHDHRTTVAQCCKTNSRQPHDKKIVEQKLCMSNFGSRRHDGATML